MNMIKTPVNGMRDIEPKEMEIRQYILSKIREVYSKFGFVEIETPNIEHIENLLSDLGWDNEKLIFKILKRGDKLIKAFESGNINELVDSGLRYDLTVPLCRFYSNNKDKLIMPFKAMQLGNVYRADRPQRGRFRQFMQCDIDIMGEANNIGEIEILLATSTLLKEIKFDKYNFSFDINDRRIVRAIASSGGYSCYKNKLDEKELSKEKIIDEICIVLDKIDKIGFDGAEKELQDMFSDGSFENIKKIFDSIEKLNVETLDKNEYIDIQISKIRKVSELLGEYLEDGVAENLIEIIETVTKNADVKINFNPSLVRGMGYYTGPIFEIKSDKFSGSVGGGGRYDGMVEKFSGVSVPALGISIGFERIIGIYMEDNFSFPNNVKKIAYLIEKNMENNKKSDIINEALNERKKGNIVYVSTLSKNKKFQIENLEKLGFSEFH